MAYGGLVAFLFTALIGGCDRGGPARIEVRPGASIQLVLEPRDGFMVNEKAPTSLRLTDVEGSPVHQEWELEDLRSLRALEVKAPESRKEGELLLEGRFYLCQKTQTQLCTLVKRQARLRVSAQGTERSSLTWDLGDP